MRVFMSLGHKNLILLLGMRSCNEHEKMPKWGIFNASVLLNKHGYPPFYFKIEVLIRQIFSWQSLNENLLSLLFQGNYLNRRIESFRSSFCDNYSGVCRLAECMLSNCTLKQQKMKTE